MVQKPDQQLMRVASRDTHDLFGLRDCQPTRNHLNQRLNPRKLLGTHTQHRHAQYLRTAGGHRSPSETSLSCATVTFERCCYTRSEEHTSELQSLMRHSYAVF